jgi:hypothetical protein
MHSSNVFGSLPHDQRSQPTGARSFLTTQQGPDGPGAVQVIDEPGDPAPSPQPTYSTTALTVSATRRPSTTQQPSVRSHASRSSDRQSGTAVQTTPDAVSNVMHPGVLRHRITSSSPQRPASPPPGPVSATAGGATGVLRQPMQLAPTATRATQNPPGRTVPLIASARRTCSAAGRSNAMLGSIHDGEAACAMGEKTTATKSSERARMSSDRRGPALWLPGENGSPLIVRTVE